MFSIGEFSKITGLTVKTLRFYHERGLLVPTAIDDQSGYRYYDADKVELARMIAQLRELEFSLDDIAAMMHQCAGESDLLRHLELHRRQLAAKAEHYRRIESRLDEVILQQRQARWSMQNATFEVVEKTVEDILIVGIRMKGKYSDCSKGFSRLGRKWGRYICGPCFLLHYDQEYKEDDADFEACFPIRPSGAKTTAGQDTDESSIRELSGGRCVALLHRGPYDALGRSYEKILKYVKSKKYTIETPTREVYLKGPGMIFKGNPNKYLTEIQLLIQPSTD
jgi:DNA-binding transcriptional MerR regulator/DNA gyrase inhibitor GyrI